MATGNGERLGEGCAKVGTEVGVNHPAKGQRDDTFSEGLVIANAECVLGDSVIAVAAAKHGGEVPANDTRFDLPLILATGGKPCR